MNFIGKRVIDVVASCKTKAQLEVAKAYFLQAFKRNLVTFDNARVIGKVIKIKGYVVKP